MGTTSHGPPPSHGPPQCPGPDLAPRPASFRPPSDGVDCHFHVFEDPALYPYASARSYTPAPASLDDYVHLQSVLGIRRGVLVQPSVYGTNNRLLIDLLRRRGEDWRGIAVVASRVSDAELEVLQDAGVRGVRINLLFRGGTPFEEAGSLARRIAALGWHLQVLMDVSRFENLGRRLGDLAVPVVFDHFGHMPAARGPADRGFQDMLALLREGRAWVKLSAPYRISSEAGPPYDDVTPLADAILDAAPDRAVWASDWPHPGISKPMPNDGDLFDLLARWAPDPALRERILRDNACALYGFGDTQG